MNKENNKKKLIVIVGLRTPNSLSREIKEKKIKPLMIHLPEIKAHPKEQIEWVKNELLNLINKDDNEYEVIILKTFSDYIIREINYYIMKGDIDYNNVSICEDTAGTLIPSSEDGIVSETIDKVIDEQNDRLENLYYKIRYED